MVTPALDKAATSKQEGKQEGWDLLHLGGGTRPVQQKPSPWGPIAGLRLAPKLQGHCNSTATESAFPPTGSSSRPPRL